MQVFGRLAGWRWVDVHRLHGWLQDAARRRHGTGMMGAFQDQWRRAGNAKGRVCVCVGDNHHMDVCSNPLSCITDQRAKAAAREFQPGPHTRRSTSTTGPGEFRKAAKDANSCHRNVRQS